LPTPRSVIAPSFNGFKATLVGSTSSANTVVDEYRIPEAVPCFNQLEIGACVLNAWCGLLELLLGIEGKTVAPLSRLFPYYLCREVMGNITKDSGTYPSLAADRFMKVGCISEAKWPYDPKFFSVKPTDNTLDLFSEADDNKIVSSYRLDSTTTMGNDIETCVLGNHGVVIALGVSQAIMDAEPDDVLDIPDPKDVIGGHCMLTSGRRKLRNGTRQWRIRNSWGSDWCDNGHVWITERYLLTSEDNWTGTRMDALTV
jgi:hypothetical protein